MNTNPSAPAPSCDCGHNHGTNLPLILSAVSLVASVLTLCFLFLGVSKSIEPENDYGQVGIITGDNDAPAGEQPSEEGGGGGYEPLPDEPAYNVEKGQAGFADLSHKLPMLNRYDDSGLSSFIYFTSNGGEYVNRELLVSLQLPSTWVIGPSVTDSHVACPNAEDFISCTAVYSLLPVNPTTQGVTRRALYIYMVRTDRKSSPAVTDLPAVFLTERNGRSFYMSTSGDEYGKPGMDTPEWKTIFEEGKKIRESFTLING